MWPLSETMLQCNLAPGKLPSYPTPSKLPCGPFIFLQRMNPHQLFFFFLDFHASFLETSRKQMQKNQKVTTAPPHSMRLCLVLP